MNARPFALTAVLAVLFLGVLSCTRKPSAEGEAWWAHVRYLASDSLEGRNTGSEGYRRAADYVADQFRQAGALPGADGGYLQPVDVITRKVREAECRLELIRNGEAQPVVLGDEAAISTRLESAADIEAPVVFAGYAISAPRAGYDDLDGLDLEGAIVAYISGGPASLPGPIRAHTQSIAERWKALRARGARGLLRITNPAKSDVPWERGAKRRLAASMTLADPALDETPGLEFAATLNGERSERWFEGSGHTLQELLDLASREQPLPRFPLDARLRAHVAFDRGTAESPNVVAIVPGSDPGLKNTYVVLSAHLDHLGVGGAVAGDSIYNGAMDNAAGVASLIEIAKMAKARGVKLRRSLLLLAVTGEEKGELGSRYFAAHPTVPIGRIAADLNLDMFLPIVPFRILTVYGLRESDLGDWIVPVAEKHGVRVQDDPEPERRIFVRSDQYSFIRQGVPALSFKIGFVKGSREAKVFADWTKQRYHAPSDDVNQPVNLDAAAGFTEMLYDFAIDVADRDVPPRWKETSFFRRYSDEAGR